MDSHDGVSFEHVGHQPHLNEADQSQYEDFGQLELHELVQQGRHGLAVDFLHRVRDSQPFEQLLDSVVTALQPDICGLELRALDFALQVRSLQEAVVVDDDHLGLGAEESHHVGGACFAVDDHSGLEVERFLHNDPMVILVHG